MNPQRVLVDMSATILHHGHVRLLAKASRLGEVVVALTSDEEIVRTKGYQPELRFEERKEILESIKYVSEVVESPWLIDDNFLEIHNCGFLVHGDDNSNTTSPERTITFGRTAEVSSTEIRQRVLRHFRAAPATETATDE